MQNLKLGDISEIKTGKFDVNHSTDDGEYIFYTCAKEQFKSPTYSFEGEAILLPGNGANVGEVFFNPGGKFEAYQRTYVIQNIKAYPKYVYYILKSSWKNSLNNSQYGSATNYIRLNNITDFLIPLPSITDQIRIATVLSKAESLIAKRKEGIKLLDEFLKSTFLEMFGDPVRNEKGWKVESLGKYLTKITAGSSYGGVEKQELDESELGVLKVSAVTWGSFNPNEFKAVSKNIISKKIINPFKGDLLFSRANTRELVGATCIVDDDYPNLFLPDKIWKLEVDENLIKKEYIHSLLQFKSFKNTLTKDATGSSGSMLNISMEKLRNLKCPIPDIKIQTKFSRIVEKIDKLNKNLKDSLNELENLYNSLSHKAFKGELYLDKIEVEHLVGKEETPKEQPKISKTAISEAIKASNSIVKQFERTTEIAKAATRFSKYFEQWDKLYTPFKELPTVPVEILEAQEKITKIREVFSKVPLSKPNKGGKISWDKVSFEQVSIWIKEKYNGYHFSSEMLMRFLTEEHVTFPDYYSSEELKKQPSLNDADDIKSFLFTALSDGNPFLQLEQLFYNAEKENFQLKVTKEDYELLKDRDKKERSGIYFTIKK